MGGWYESPGLRGLTQGASYGMTASTYQREGKAVDALEALWEIRRLAYDEGNEES